MPIKHTPVIAQYLRIKEQVPDALLFFRLGDFYELFFEDAETGSRVLDIQLTSRSKDGTPLCGVPYHAAQPYIAKLLKAGHKVAICEQAAADNDNKTKSLMPRRIVRVITPGTVNDELVLSADQKNFLLALAGNEMMFGLAALDVSTGEFVAAVGSHAHAIEEEIARLDPREILISKDLDPLPPFLSRLNCPLNRLDHADFDVKTARATLARRFGSGCLADDDLMTAAAGAALAYLERTFGQELNHLQSPRVFATGEYLLVDEVSRRHLELVVTSDGTKKGSLFSILDETVTAAGARTLSHWIVYPLLDLNTIGRRHDAIEELFSSDLLVALSEKLAPIGDLERLVGRMGAMRAGPRDCVRLAQALAAIGLLKESLSGCRGEMLPALAERMRPEPELAAQIRATLQDEPSADAHEGNIVRPTFDSRVDELHQLASDARGFIANLEARERSRSGIGSLRVRYNQIFGYYIEVTKPHLSRVPADYERKQTLVSAERFTTAELKDLESKILGAESNLRELELQIFNRLLRTLAANASALEETARAVAELDAILSLARVARRRDYVRPIMNDGLRLFMRDGRHPVLEAGMKRAEFVPNDLDSDPAQRQLLLITGPNMAGKSTYLRQVALIVIMAQMGSFVPAAEAVLGVVDRLFTRIGARDELRRGESTFMVEMRETARLLKGLSERSLLLLDEVGRGTSTFDGLAIAWSIAEYLHDRGCAKILFATHFHELTDLARERSRVKNLSMTVREWGGEVVFLRRVAEGAANRSYGIEVAKLAGLPEQIIIRAREILHNLEQGELDEAGMARLARCGRRDTQTAQLNLFSSTEKRLLNELEAIDPNALTPIEALATLARLVEQVQRGRN